MIEALRQICPPIIWTILGSLKQELRQLIKDDKPEYVPSDDVKQQDLDVYWDPEMAAALETWGEGNVWNEIQYLMINCKGHILDIACGSGKTMELVNKFESLNVCGCDISDTLIAKAIDRGIKKDVLKVCDATDMPYEDNTFDFSYSIGSLEHFTEDGISEFLREAHRVTKIGSFHMVPVSNSDTNEGWVKVVQSFHNNSHDWWLEKYREIFKRVYVVDSSWCDGMSDGKWFLCFKD